MSGPALVGLSKDPAVLFSIHLEEQIAPLGPSQPAKEQISTSTTAIEEECQLAATEPIPEDAFPELNMAYPAVKTGLSPHPIRNAVYLPGCGHNFCDSAWRAISVSGRVTISGGENIIPHFVDTEIINHRFLYPNWDRPAQMFDADFSPETPPHTLIHYHGPPLRHRCPACQEPVSSLPQQMIGLPTTATCTCTPSTVLEP
ncbi:hypothetical protein B0H14DRAFT_2605424 [Mycena olivaceomarginata]|nr:hypothetical protein B0H14DRAFT_2605424 [Mycena olivaceomarginata]